MFDRRVHTKQINASGMPQKRVMVLALTSGEADVPFHKQSVALQEGCDVDYVEIANLPNREAHATLYSRIMSAGPGYDAFVKLDGDMVLRERTALSRMIAALQPGVDVVTFPVLDFAALRPIYGLHVFSPRCSWKVDELREPFVDPMPSVPGRTVMQKPRSWAPAYHNYFMSLEQAFAFGVHRGYKAFRTPVDGDGNPRPRFMGAPGAGYIRTLKYVWDAFVHTRDPLRGAVMVGAERVRSVARQIGPFAYKDVTQFADGLDLAASGSYEDIWHYCAPYWSFTAPVWVAAGQVVSLPERILRRIRPAGAKAPVEGLTKT